MSIMDRVQQVLADYPNTSWNDLVRRQLETTLSTNVGAIPDLWDLWFRQQGYQANSLNDNMALYWTTNLTPPSERNVFYFAVTALFTSSGTPGAWLFDDPVQSGHLLTSGVL